MAVVDHRSVLARQFLLVATRLSLDDLGVVTVSQHYFVGRARLDLQGLGNVGWA